jgi:hypothetical protein
MDSIINSENYIQFNKNIIDIEKQIDVCKLLINTIQSSQNNTGECFLSFYPLSKNIRFLSSHFFDNIQKGLNPKLSNNPRPGEDYFWKQKTGENSWYPWLWSRNYKNNNSTKDSLNNILKDIERIVDISKFDENYINDLKNYAIEPLPLYLACLDHVFSLNNDLENKLLNNELNYEWPSGPVCGLQIRRGETTKNTTNIDGAWAGRKVYSLDEYMEKTKYICDILNTNNIFVSTDSSETIDYLKQKYTNYNFFDNKYDKNLFVRYSTDWKKEFIDSPSLELQLSKKLELIDHYNNSCLADLICLSKCNGYVGGMTISEYGILGWFLQMAKQKKITPYFNIEGNLKQKNLVLL